MVCSIAYTSLRSALRTCTTLRLVSGSARRKMYSPGGSCTPGNWTVRLNVKVVRLSNGSCAYAAELTKTSKASAHAEVAALLSINLTPPICPITSSVPPTSVATAIPADLCRNRHNRLCVSYLRLGSRLGRSCADVQDQQWWAGAIVQK